MPNHITTNVEIKHEDASKIAELVKATKLKLDGNAEENEFDFNGIIQMPEELRDTESGSSESWGLAAFDDESFEYMKSMPWFAEKYEGISSKDELKARYESSDDEQEKKYLEVGKKAFECKQKYGYTSWYDWANANWGTKWNAYQVRYIAGDEHKIVLEFQTAWAYPEPVLDKLVEQGFEVNGFWEDEGGGDGEIGDDAWSVFDKQTVYEYLG